MQKNLQSAEKGNTTAEMGELCDMRRSEEDKKMERDADRKLWKERTGRMVQQHAVPDPYPSTAVIEEKEHAVKTETYYIIIINILKIKYCKFHLF